jgi:hypothetical protein
MLNRGVAGGFSLSSTRERSCTEYGSLLLGSAGFDGTLIRGAALLGDSPLRTEDFVIQALEFRYAFRGHTLDFGYLFQGGIWRGDDRTRPHS